MSSHHHKEEVTISKSGSICPASPSNSSQSSYGRFRYPSKPVLSFLFRMPLVKQRSSHIETRPAPLLPRPHQKIHRCFFQHNALKPVQSAPKPIPLNALKLKKRVILPHLLLARQHLIPRRSSRDLPQRHRSSLLLPQLHTSQQHPQKHRTPKKSKRY